MYYDVEEFSATHTAILLDDATGNTEERRAAFASRSLSYYMVEFRHAPSSAGDLLLGIALDSPWWWLPVGHPIARLLKMNAIEPTARMDTLLCYSKEDVARGQQGLFLIVTDKGLTHEGALWDDEDEDE